MTIEVQESNEPIVFSIRSNPVKEMYNSKGYALWEAQEPDLFICVQQIDIVNWKVTATRKSDGINRTFIRHCLFDMYETVTNLTGKNPLFNASLSIPLDYNPMAHS